jgi:hypothetical protein
LYRRDERLTEGETTNMHIGKVLAVAAAVCAMLATTGGAEAAKKKGKAKAKDTIVVSGCARFAPPFCTSLTSKGTTYMLSPTTPPIPRDTGVTVVGRKTGNVGPCFGTWLEVKSWKPNRLLCTQK